MEDYQDIDLIEKFHDETLTPEEEKRFQTKFRDDPQFAEEVERYIAVSNVLAGAKKVFNRQKSRTISRRFYWVAASVSILVISGFFLLINGKTASTIGQEFFINERFVNSRNHTQDTEEKGLFQQAMDAYFNDQKSETITIIRGLSKKNPSHLDYQFMLGDLYFEIGKPDSAIYYYQNSLSSGENDDYAHWNLAMAYLLNGQLEEAKKQLEVIAKFGRSPHRDNAQKIMEDLTSIAYKMNPKNWFSK